MRVAITFTQNIRDRAYHRAVRTVVESLIIGFIVLAATPYPSTSLASDAGAVRRIGFLASENPPDHVPFAAAFRKGLAEGGYIEGKNVIVERRYSVRDASPIPGLVAELMRLRAEVLVTDSTRAALAVRETTSTIPIVTISGDPLGAGLVASLGRPGGNVTAISTFGPGPAGKRLALLKEAVPTIRQVGMVWNPQNPTGHMQVKETRTAATHLGVGLQLVPIQPGDDVDRALAALPSVDAIIITEDPLLDGLRPRIGRFALRKRLPAVCSYRNPGDESCLLWYGPNILALYPRLGVYAAKILSGDNVSDLPVEQPMIFSLVINSRKAKALGLAVPQSLLAIADEVIH